MKHISQYFEPAKVLLQNSSTSIQEMRAVLKSTGCPIDKIESVINGILKDDIQMLIPRDGMTVEELSRLLNVKVTDITEDYIQKLLNKICTSGFIDITDNKVHNLKISVPNFPVDLE